MTVTDEDMRTGPVAPPGCAPTGHDRPDVGLGAGFGFAAGSQLVVVTGVLGHVGATGVAAGVAGAGLSAGLSVRLLDAAPPRRAGLSQLVSAEGATTETDSGTQVVTSTDCGLQVQYVRASAREGLDERCDRPTVWEQRARPADVTVVDPGCAVEDTLRTGEGRCWLDPGVLGESAWVVLVVPSTSGGLRRTEAVLQEWTAAGLAAVGQVVLSGPGPLRDAVRGQAGALTRRALEISVRQAWDQDVYGLAYGPESLGGALTDAGEQVLTAFGGVAGQAVGHRAAGRSRRGMRKWRKQQ